MQGDQGIQSQALADGGPGVAALLQPQAIDTGPGPTPAGGARWADLAEWQPAGWAVEIGVPCSGSTEREARGAAVAELARRKLPYCA